MLIGLLFLAQPRNKHLGVQYFQMDCIVQRLALDLLIDRFVPGNIFSDLLVVAAEG